MQLILLILNSVGLVGVAVFLVLTFRGLRERIANLTKLAEEQKETLEAVRTRATELDQLRKDYKQGLEDFQQLGERIQERREILLKEVETALSKKDEQLAQAKQLELKDLDLKQQSLEMIPQLQERLAQTVEQMQRQLQTLDSLLDQNRFGTVPNSITSADIIRDIGVLMQPANPVAEPRLQARYLVSLSEAIFRRSRTRQEDPD